MRGVSRTEGIRRRCANRRTVDSLTCRISASCFAVRNSSRSDMALIWSAPAAGSPREHLAWGALDALWITNRVRQALKQKRRQAAALQVLFRILLIRQRHAINHGALNLDVFRSRLGAVSFQRYAILRRIRGQTKNKFAGLARHP